MRILYTFFVVLLFVQTAQADSELNLLKNRTPPKNIYYKGGEFPLPSP